MIPHRLVPRTQGQDVSHRVPDTQQALNLQFPASPHPSIIQRSKHSGLCFWPQTMLPPGLSGHTWGIISAASGLACLPGSHPTSLPPLRLLGALTAPDTAPKISEDFKASTLDSIQIAFLLGMHTGGEGWRVGPSLFLDTGHSSQVLGRCPCTTHISDVARKKIHNI